MKQFNNAEDKTSNEWRPHCLPHTCQQDLDTHQELCQLVEALKEPLTNIRAEAEGLKPQASHKDIQTLAGLTDDLEDRWQRLMTITEDKQVTTPPHMPRPLTFLSFSLESTRGC